jgi:YaiO family outer membrane protein
VGGWGRALAIVSLACNTPGFATAQLPTSSDAVLRLHIDTLRQQQRLDEALNAYRALAASQPLTFEDRVWVARLTGWAGHPVEAESLFTALLRERPDDYDSRIGLIDVRLRLEHYAAAQADLETLMPGHGDNPEVLFRHGRLCQALGKRDEARRYFEQVIAATPHHPESREALRQLAVGARWASGIEYYGEHMRQAPATRRATASFQARPGDRLRWEAAATLQQKFEQTELRLGAELAHAVVGAADLHWSAYVAPGAVVLPRQTYGLGLAQRLGRRLVVYGDYALLDFQDADVHRAGSRLEFYAGRRWILTATYVFASTHFSSADDAVDNHAGSASIGYLYGAANQLRVSAAAGGESFTLPSIDMIGGFSARTIAVDWRQFVSPWLGIGLAYAYQARSDGLKQHSYSLGLVRRW